jgi:hypothetical protein
MLKSNNDIMPIEYFVSRLNNLKPSEEDLIKLGFDEVFIKSVIDGYQCKKRTHVLNGILNKNTIISLMQEYDCSSVQIGLIQLHNRIIEEEDFYRIGEVEADILVLNKITFQIEVRELLSLDNILWTCASNADNFLDTLLICAQFFSLRIKKPELADDISFTHKTVLECSQASGGIEYIDFYKMLLGYFN